MTDKPNDQPPTEPKTEQNPPDSAATQDSQAVEQGRDPVRRWTLIFLAAALILMTWYILADRHAPWTDQARVEAFVVPIAPQVAGEIIKVHALQDQGVQAGQLLAEIDPSQYELAVRQATANLRQATQGAGAGAASVEAAAAGVTEAEVRLLKARQDLGRVQGVYEQDPGAISESAVDEARAAVAAAEAQLANAIADLERAREELGATGSDNPGVQQAVAALKQANLDLGYTKIYAPSRGGITNLIIDEGHYAAVGAPIMTFVSAEDVWVKAYLRENSLEHVKIGDRAEIALDVLPGRVFEAQVTSLGFAVNPPSGGAVGDLENVRTSSSWLRDAQRFPVTLRFTTDDAKGFRRHGAQADVQIYTGNNFVLNGLGYLWVRFMSLLSYVY